MNNSDRSSKTETAFKLFDMNKDGYITREEFKKVGHGIQHCKIKSLSKGLEKTGLNPN
jgi:Ca2+-binding EF-hand superfamily protein